VLYLITPPNNQPAVTVVVQDQVQDAYIRASYCGPVTSDFQHTTLAGLPMTYGISGEGQLDRTWAFVNAQRTVFAVSAGDAQSSSAIQAQNDAILATFRHDDPTPYAC
jgi:uncharacterized protein YfaP (DUF2135 family)